MKYFTGIKTVEGLWKRYRELLKKLHFDNENGSVEITQEINSEYDHFKVILNKIIGFNMTIEVIGSWVWCFNTSCIERGYIAKGINSISIRR